MSSSYRTIDTHNLEQVSEEGPLSNSFVAIDFETANSSKASACEVGLVKVVDGKAVERLESLIKPHPEHALFEGINMSIHGIHASHVVAAPEFDALWPSLRDFIGDLPLVAHYAAFDTRVLRELLFLYGIPIPTMEYFCTLVLSRRVLDLTSYTLPFVADELGVPEAAHHRALADAERAASVALALLVRANYSDLPTLATGLQLSPGRFDAASWLGTGSFQHSPSATKATIAEMREAVDSTKIDATGALFERKVAFTGGLTSMTREEAWFRVIAAGGDPELNMTQKTDYLVVGTEGSYSIDPKTANTAKFKKAELLRSKGQSIEIIDELTFLQMI